MNAHRPRRSNCYLRGHPELSPERVDLEASAWRQPMIDLADPLAIKHASQANRKARLRERRGPHGWNWDTYFSAKCTCPN